ncbi:MAG: M4 family metallopeptidase [Pseudomonadota bacterium]
MKNGKSRIVGLLAFVAFSNCIAAAGLENCAMYLATDVDFLARNISEVEMASAAMDCEQWMEVVPIQSVSEGQPTNGLPSYLSAPYENAGLVSNYIKTVDNDWVPRDSYDLSGAFNVYVLSKNSDTAYWHPVNRVIVLGKGKTDFQNLSADLDTLSHEFLHALMTANGSAPLTTEGRAIGESLSDFFAAAVSRHYNRQNVWEISEQSFVDRPGDFALRYLSNPTRSSFNYGSASAPLKMRDHFGEAYSGTGDQGGRHVNSGFVSLALYLMSEGGLHPRADYHGDFSHLTISSTEKIGLENVARLLRYMIETRQTNIRNFGFSGFKKELVDASRSILNRTGQAYTDANRTAICKAFAQVGIADAASECAPYVTLPQKPANPANVTIQRDYCYGSNTLSWSAVSGATKYKVFLDNGALVANTSELETTLDVPYAGYVTLKACNVTCSSGVKKMAQYYSGCR